MDGRFSSQDDHVMRIQGYIQPKPVLKMVKFNIYGRGLGLRMAIMFTCQLAFIFFGYDQGVFSGIVGNEDFLRIVNHPSPGILGIIVSIYNLGCFSGTIVSFLLSDKLGPRKSMWFAMCWIIVGATLQTTSFSRAQLLVSRFITGIGTGVETTVVPVYQSELCEAKKRGKYVCSEPLFVGVGIVIAYWFDYGMSYVEGPVNWRLPIACQMVFAIFVILLVFGLPESPRWLYRHERNDEALQVLCDVFDRAPDDEKVAYESEGILEAIELETLHGEYKWSQILKKDEVQTGRRVLLAYGMQFMNQMGGINLVVYYVTSVLEDNVGLSRKLSLLLGGVIQVMFVIGSFYPTFFSDRFGRRKPMMYGSFGLFICMMLISILLSFKGKPQEKETASASVAFFFLFMLIFGASVNCIPWVYGPEILPLHVRTKGHIRKLALEFLRGNDNANPDCESSLEGIVYFFYPETANLTLEEIDFLFTERRHEDGVRGSVSGSGSGVNEEGNEEKGEKC
ncbi:Sugar and other transporter [Aspergillus sclerotialis]|uniref:Sugar and other transporter n=1 Tax=Aspergillus sclerotialis TaxID=2070753 RepID=A0A3A2ZAY4_9EURO|nr:Sugar and other transporter [Aspergillus sclerotialis]